jgi:hypothetical protein
MLLQRVSRVVTETEVNDFFFEFSKEYPPVIVRGLLEAGVSMGLGAGQADDNLDGQDAEI